MNEANNLFIEPNSHCVSSIDHIIEQVKFFASAKIDPKYDERISYLMTSLKNSKARGYELVLPLPAKTDSVSEEEIYMMVATLLIPLEKGIETTPEAIAKIVTYIRSLSHPPIDVEEAKEKWSKAMNEVYSLEDKTPLKDCGEEVIRRFLLALHLPITQGKQ